MNDILDRLEDASNFAGNVFGGIFQDARKELIAANTEIENLHERIKILTDGESLMRRNAQEWKDAYIAELDALAKEQEVSYKLEKALRELSLYVAYNSDDWVKRQATAALAEVAAIRVGD